MSWWEGLGRIGIPVHKTLDLEAIATGTFTPLFNIVGGRVKLVHLVGRVDEVPAVSAGTILLRLRLDPVIGAVTDMCADSADVVALAQYSLITITGAVAVAMAITAGATGVQVLHSLATNQQDLEAGIIGLLNPTGAGNITAGIVSWTIHYLPLDLSAAVVAA